MDYPTSSSDESALYKPTHFYLSMILLLMQVERYGVNSLDYRNNITIATPIAHVTDDRFVSFLSVLIER